MSTLAELEASLTSVQIREIRRSAIQFLYQSDVSHEGAFREGDFAHFCQQLAVPDANRPFLKELVRQTMERREELDGIIGRHSKNWKLSRIGRVDLATLRVCTYELLERLSVGREVVIADAAEIGKQFGSSGSGAFINGVLDSVAKEIRPHGESAI